MRTLSHKSKNRIRAFLRVFPSIIIAVLLFAPLVWVVAADSFVDQTEKAGRSLNQPSNPIDPVGCPTTELGQLVEGKGIIFEGVSPGCYSAGFCGQCDVLVVLKNVAEINFAIIGTFATLFIMIGGAMYILSRGNEQMVGNAKKAIGASITGVVISFLAWSIVASIGYTISGDQSKTFTSFACTDVPAISTCSLVTGVGAIQHSDVQAFRSGVGDGNIIPCDAKVVPGQYMFNGVDMGKLFNDIGAELNIDPVFLLTLFRTETNLGKYNKESVTGAYGPMQIQPSTAAANWGSSAPADCKKERSDKSKPWTGIDDGYCRHKPSKGDNDPSCGTIDEGRSVIEHYTNSCKAFIDSAAGLDEYMRMFGRVVDKKRATAVKHRDGSLGATAEAYSGLGPKGKGYAVKASGYHRKLCKDQGGTVYDQADASQFGSRGGSPASSSYNTSFFGQLDGNTSSKVRGPGDITYIVLHEGTKSRNGIEGLIRTFKERNASSHYAIERDGTIYQLADEKLRTWHAVGINTQSIGIDLMKETSNSPNWTAAQYRATQQLIHDIQGRHPSIILDDDHVIAHKEVKGTSHQDPRDFRWESIGLNSAPHERGHRYP